MMRRFLLLGAFCAEAFAQDTTAVLEGRSGLMLLAAALTVALPAYGARAVEPSPAPRQAQAAAE